jgi:hypothetical protein
VAIAFYHGAKTHGEFVNSTVAFDKKRAANGEKGYAAGTLFEPKMAWGFAISRIFLSGCH